MFIASTSLTYDRSCHNVSLQNPADVCDEPEKKLNFVVLCTSNFWTEWWAKIGIETKWKYDDTWCARYTQRSGAKFLTLEERKKETTEKSRSRLGANALSFLKESFFFGWSLWAGVTRSEAVGTFGSAGEEDLPAEEGGSLYEDV